MQLPICVVLEGLSLGWWNNEDMPCHFSNLYLEMYYTYMFLCKAGNKFSSEVLQLNHKSGVENYIKKDISKYRLLKCDTHPELSLLSRALFR